VVQLPLEFVQSVCLKVQQERPDMSAGRLNTESVASVCTNILSKQRMSFALKNLLQEPQNNLKIFKNGTLIYGCKDEKDSLQDLNTLIHHLKPYFYPANGLISGSHGTRTVLNDLIHVITVALLSATDSRRKYIPEGRTYCEASTLHREILRKGISDLPKDCVLSKILQAQTLDNLDIEGLYPLYRRVQQHLEEFPEER
ncbi:IPPK kinase, partial [Polypterus senegalus]